MDAQRPSSAPEVFRPRGSLAIAMGAAGLLWVVVLVYLLQFPQVETRTVLSVLFFIGFFGLSLAYYARTAIYVDAAGMTYRGLVHTLRFPFEEIRKVDILPGPVTVYAVWAKGIGIHFTSFFAQHRRLMELVVERARLTPLGGL